MSPEPSKTAIRAWARLMRAQQAALSQIEKALKAAGLPPLAWYDVLLELDRIGDRGLRPFELEREMLMPQYSLSRLLDRMEAAGHIARQPCEEDGRGLIVAITPSGKDLRRRMWPTYAAAIDSAVAARLTEDEASVLDNLLGRLLAAPEA